jgi:hypothetical protein
VNISRQQFIALACALLLQLGLFASLAHAAEHPFHVQDELCASFISFGQQDLSLDDASAAIEFNMFSVGLFAENKASVQSSFRPVYSSRAPPAS